MRRVTMNLTNLWRNMSHIGKSVLSLVVFIYILPSALSDGEISQCNDYQECQNEPFNNNTFINCYGFLSCQNSSLYSYPGGYIDCTSDSSCSHSTIIAANDIYCNGASSCIDSPSITGDTIQCGGYAACYHSPHSPNQQTTIFASNVSCSGTGSCKNSYIKSHQNVNCDGKKSCHAANIESGNHWIIFFPNHINLSKL